MPVVNIVPALNIEDLPPASLEQLKRQAIALIYAIGRAEGVRYKLVVVRLDTEQEAETG